MAVKSISKFFKISLIVCLVAPLSLLKAQEPAPADSTKETPKTKTPLRLDGFRLGLDLVPPIIYAFDQDFRNFEVSGEFIFNHRFLLAFDLGNDRRIRGKAGTYSYQSTGNYLRVGLDYNFWYRDKNQLGSLLTLGLRYGLARFEHSLVYAITNEYWGPAVLPFSQTLEATGLTAHWAEVTASLKARLFKRIYMGPLVRLRIKIATSASDSLAIHDIAGFGINNTLKIRIGYQLFYMLPF